jgi:hypothetical protein
MDFCHLVVGLCAAAIYAFAFFFSYLLLVILQHQEICWSSRALCVRNLIAASGQRLNKAFLPVGTKTYLGWIQAESERESTPNKAKTQSCDGTGLTRAAYLPTVAIVYRPQNSRIRGRAVPRFTSMLEVINALPARAFSLPRESIT